jgi:hypothetical protein
MFGQFPELLPCDGVVPVCGVVDDFGVVLVPDEPVAAFAIAAPPPRTAQTRATLSRAFFIRVIARSPPFRGRFHG